VPQLTIPCQETLSSQAETFKALAHPARLAIVHALADGPVCACDLATMAQSTASTTSRHLTVLRHAGIISNNRKGQQIYYQLERPCLLTFIDCCNS
jgi:DNA-binding transcriptional ArsR family regulator